MIHFLRVATARIPVEWLWVNPDCGLKTRGWPETRAALAAMVNAARAVREQPLQLTEENEVKFDKVAYQEVHASGCCTATGM